MGEVQWTGPAEVGRILCRNLLARPYELYDGEGLHSATAMFAYAMAVGCHRGWLKAEVYLPAVTKAWEALLARLDPEGNLADVCVGTGQGKEAIHYLTRPRRKGDLHGQAPLLWLAGELLPAG